MSNELPPDLGGSSFFPCEEISGFSGTVGERVTQGGRAIGGASRTLQRPEIVGAGRKDERPRAVFIYQSAKIQINRGFPLSCQGVVLFCIFEIAISKTTFRH